MAIPGFNFSGMSDEEIQSAVRSGSGQGNYDGGGYPTAPIRAAPKINSQGYVDYTREPGIKRPTTAAQRRVEGRAKNFKDGMYEENQKKIARQAFEEQTRGMERQQSRDFFGVSERAGELRTRSFEQEMRAKQQQQDIGFIRTSKDAMTIQERAFKEQLKGLSEQQKTELWQSSALFKAGKKVMQGAEQSFGSAASLAGTAALGQDFTPEQHAMKQMFGGGEKFWGINNEPVTLYNDLNPRQRGDRGTANLFGFGDENERSGLF